MIARAARPRSTARSRRRAEWLAAAWFLGGALLVALAIRSAIVMPRSIPSESMMPGLVAGDYVLVAKWPYGWSRFSLPFALPLPHGRIAGRLPARGDVVVFRAPDGRSDYIKRVIGLPGDRVAMRDGRLVLNGRIVPRYRIADFVLPIGRDTQCRSMLTAPYGRTDDGGRALCRLPRWRETLPGGRAFDVIDQGPTMQDDMAETMVPAGRLFLLGDNRDLSEDSRFPVAAGGIGMVPVDALEGRAGIIAFSTGGGLAGIRPARIGAGAG